MRERDFLVKQKQPRRVRNYTTFHLHEHGIDIYGIRATQPKENPIIAGHAIIDFGKKGAPSTARHIDGFNIGRYQREGHFAARKKIIEETGSSDSMIEYATVFPDEINVIKLDLDASGFKEV